MLAFTNETMRALLAKSLKTAMLTADGWKDTGDGPGSSEGNFIEWLPISDQQQSVWKMSCALNPIPSPPDIPIYGYVYDVKSGRLIEVSQATKAGAAR